MYCAKCGIKIDDDAVFCKKCGARQDVDENEQETSGSGGSGVGGFLVRMATNYVVGAAFDKAISSTGIGLGSRNPNTDKYNESAPWNRNKKDK